MGKTLLSVAEVVSLLIGFGDVIGIERLYLTLWVHREKLGHI